MTLVRNTAVTLASNVGMTLLGLLTGILLARTLGPAGRGLMTTVLLWPQMLVWACGMSFGYGNVYFGAKEPQSRRSLFANSVWVALVFGAIAGIAAVFIVPHFVPLTSQQHLLLTISFLTLSLSVWLDFATSILTSTHRFDRLATLRTSAPLLTASLLLLLWLTHTLTVTTAILATWAGGLLQMGLVLSFLIHAGYFSLKPNLALLRRSLHYGTRIHFGTLAGLATGRLDQVVMTAIVAPKALGLYAFAVTLSELLRQLSSAAGTVLFPRVAGEQNHSVRGDLISKTVRWTLMFNIIFGTILYLLSPFLVHLLWGEKFEAAIPVARILLPGTVALCVSNTMGIGLYGTGKVWAGTWAEIACLTVMMPLLWLLLPRMGILGAGIASTCGYLVHCLVTTLYFTRVFGRETLRAIRPTRADWLELKTAANRLRSRIQVQTTAAVKT